MILVTRNTIHRHLSIWEGNPGNGGIRQIDEGLRLDKRLLAVSGIEQRGTAQRRRGLVKVVYSGYLSASLLLEVYTYVHNSEHPHICKDISVDVELAMSGGWIYPEGEETGEQIITTVQYLQQAGLHLEGDIYRVLKAKDIPHIAPLVAGMIFPIEQLGSRIGGGGGIGLIPFPAFLAVNIIECR